MRGVKQKAEKETLNNMKKYELMTIAKVNIGEDKARDTSNEVRDLITKHKGKVLNEDFWGKRKFAYKIGADTEGFYDVITFEMPKEDMPVFTGKLGLLDSILRYLVTAE